MTDTQKYISNLNMPEKILLFKELYNELAGHGIEGDTELAHVNTFEASLLKSLGGSGTINEITGLREYKGGGGSPPPPPANQTVTQTSEFPTELKPFISDILGEAKGEFGREKAEGYIPFQGPQLAAFTPEQQAAFATGRQQFGAQGLAGTPLGAAGTYYAPALAATALGTAEIGAGDIGRRMDPFLQNVVDIAKREARRDEDIAQQGRAAQAVGAGSFGGSRQAIVEAEANRNLQRQLSDIQAAGLSTAFQNAQRAAEAQRARELAGGRQFAGLGESAFQRARGDITGLAGVGEAQQARSQQALDIARREFEEEKAFPQTALQRYGSIIRGFPLTPSQQTVVSQREPIAPSLAQTLLGGVGTGVGLYGAFGGFKKAGGLVGLLGGGTPTNPLRPPYNLFSGPSSRVGVPQYQSGGPLGVNLGASGGPSTAFNIPTTAPSPMDLNMILEELRRRGSRRSAGGLAGLTVSRHQTASQIGGTSVVPLSVNNRQVPSVWKNLLPDETIDRIYETWKNLPGETDPNQEFGFEEVVESPAQAAFDASKAKRIEETHPGMSVEEYDALTKAFRDKTSTRMFGPKDIFPHEVALETEGAELQRGDPNLSSQDAVELASRGDTTDAIVPATNGAGDPVDDPADEPPLDPMMAYLQGIPKPPETEVYPESLRKAHEELLAEYEKKGYGFDKWLTLADYAARLGSTAPRQGENLLSVAQRVAPPSIEKLREIGKEERAAELGAKQFKAKIQEGLVSREGAQAQQKYANEITRILTGAKLTTAEAALRKSLFGDAKIHRLLDKEDYEATGLELEGLFGRGMKNARFKAELERINPSLTNDKLMQSYLDNWTNDPAIQTMMGNHMEAWKQNFLSLRNKNASQDDIDREMLSYAFQLIQENPENKGNSTKLGRLYDSVTGNIFG
jgi:hypothetical protein